MFKVHNKNTRPRCPIYSKFKVIVNIFYSVIVFNICSSVSIVNFEQLNASWDTSTLIIPLKRKIAVVCSRVAWDIFWLATFLIINHIKKDTYKPQKFLSIPLNITMTPSHTENNYIYNRVKKVYLQIWKYSHDPFLY